MSQPNRGRGKGSGTRRKRHAATGRADPGQAAAAPGLAGGGVESGHSRTCPDRRHAPRPRFRRQVSPQNGCRFTRSPFKYNSPARLRGFRPSLPAILLLIAAIAPADVGGQQIRIVADSTEIRLDPSDSSPVIITLASGTLLDWVGESGAWYAVSVAGAPGQEDVIGYVLASEVELVGVTVPPANEPPAAQFPTRGTGPLLSVPDLEERYNSERERRSSGVSKLIWGLIVIGGSHAALEFVPPLQVPSPEDYDDNDAYQSALDRRKAAESGRSIATGLGAAIAAWGAGQIGFGWWNMRSLELELPRSAGPSLQEQYSDAFMMRSSGRRKVFWAIFLPIVAYGTVEWIPYFEVPKPEDFDNAEDFRAAETRRDRAETAKSWTYILGTGLGGWGATQWVLGARKMSQIEASVRTSALSAPLGSSVAGAPVELFASRRGTRTHIGISWSW